MLIARRNLGKKGYVYTKTEEASVQLLHWEVGASTDTEMMVRRGCPSGGFGWMGL